MRLSHCLRKWSNQGFREVFKLPDNLKYSGWYSRHMFKGMKQMQARLRNVDFVIEVHDARIPISGRNADFAKTLYGVKPHCLLLNKADLVEPKTCVAMEKSLQKADPKLTNIFWSSCIKDPDLILSEVTHLPRYNRAYTPEYNVMVIGIPNVGKSTLINALRRCHLMKKRNVTQVGDQPGVTRSVLFKIKLNENPLIYVYDTPGVVPPSVYDDEVPMKMALCHTLLVQAHDVLSIAMADYLLFWCNRHEHYTYVPTLGLEEPMDSIYEVLVRAASKHGQYRKVQLQDGSYQNVPNVRMAADIFITDFRKGRLGPIMLDDP